jgi:hypothetical protein
MAGGDDLKRAGGEPRHRGDHITAQQRIARDAARPGWLAAHPKPLPQITDPVRTVTVSFPWADVAAITRGFG